MKLKRVKFHFQRYSPLSEAQQRQAYANTYGLCPCCFKKRDNIRITKRCKKCSGVQKVYLKDRRVKKIMDEILKAELGLKKVRRMT